MRTEMSERERVRAQLAAIGIQIDDARLDQMLPSLAGLLSGVKRLAEIDLSDSEPVSTVRARHLHES